MRSWGGRKGIICFLVSASVAARPMTHSAKLDQKKRFIGFWTTIEHASLLEGAARNEGRTLSSYLRFITREPRGVAPASDSAGVREGADENPVHTNEEEVI